MSDDMIIGSSPIPPYITSKLSFHQYTIYDSTNWTEDGYLCWSAIDRNFYVMPFVNSEKKISENKPKSKLSDLKN